MFCTLTLYTTEGVNAIALYLYIFVPACITLRLLPLFFTFITTAFEGVEEITLYRSLPIEITIPARGWVPANAIVADWLSAGGVNDAVNVAAHELTFC